jgi:hypothetical protein
VTLNAAVKPKSEGFKTAQYEDDFYDWCRLRSGDVLQANANLAAEYGASWYGPGWYWDPWFDAWAFPYDWGWGYYSPFFGYGGCGFYPYGGGFGGRGFGGRGFGGGGFHVGGGFHGGGGGHGR